MECISLRNKRNTEKVRACFQVSRDGVGLNSEKRKEGKETSHHDQSASANRREKTSHFVMITYYHSSPPFFLPHTSASHPPVALSDVRLLTRLSIPGEGGGTRIMIGLSIETLFSSTSPILRRHLQFSHNIMELHKSNS